MGACFNSMELDGKLPKKEVIIEFNARCRQDGYESGHSYSGSFSEFRGLVFHDKMFDTGDEAYMYVTEHGQKWGPAVCVRYKHFKPTFMLKNQQKVIADLQRHIHNAGVKLQHAQQKMRINNRSTKPAYVTKAEEKLKAVKDSVEPKVQAREDKIKEIELKLATKSKDIRWYLGGWCSS